MDDLSLLTDRLPAEIIVAGEMIRIDTRWHVQIDIADHLQNPELTPKERLFYLVSRFTGDTSLPEESWEGVLVGWNDFYACRDERLDGGRSSNGGSNVKVFDFWNDARLIIAGFQQAYGIDLFADHMHWWRFLCLLEGLPSSTRLAERMNLRATKPEKGKYADAEYNKRLQLAKAGIRLVKRYHLTEEAQADSWQASLNRLEI